MLVRKLRNARTGVAFASAEAIVGHIVAEGIIAPDTADRLRIVEDYHVDDSGEERDEKRSCLK